MGILFIATLLFSSCGSSRQASVQAPTPTQDPAQPVMANGEQVLLTFCIDEAYDKPGEYMAGLGIAEDRPDRSRAITDANRVAIADIATRYIGMIKNAIEDYSKDVNVPSNKKMYESSLEGGAQAIGTKVIDKYANVVCRKIAQSATGGYVGYVAVHVLLDDAKKGLAEELEVRKVDYDKKKFFEKIDAADERGNVDRHRFVPVRRNLSGNRSGAQDLPQFRAAQRGGKRSRQGADAGGKRLRAVRHGNVGKSAEIRHSRAVFPEKETARSREFSENGEFRAGELELRSAELDFAGTTAGNQRT